MQGKGERFELRLNQETLERIDNWRSQQRDLPSRSEAVRKLVTAGLGRPEHAQLFELARFSVVTIKGSRQISDAYVHAWEAGVYPFFDESMQLHQPFEQEFEVSAEMVEELSKFFDQKWLEKKVPSFYETEAFYDVWRDRGHWDRVKLMNTCRYMFLKGLFDQGFWSALLKQGDHPVEVSSITREPDPRDNDL